MAYYFFIDTDQLFNQALDGEFGSITNSGTNSEKFQITSKQNCQLNSKAYAISEGLIMIQPNESSSSLVNIILKPLKQAIDTIAIDYFIYRGVKKDSIFNGSLVKTSGNDLCVQVNNTITKLNQKYPLDTHTPEEYILSHGAIADNDFITNIQPIGGLVDNVTLNQAFNTRNLLYKPFKISGGSYIGDYNSEFGIDVVLKKANAKISDARKSDNFIISLKQIGLSGEDLLMNKAEKEKSLNYFDIYQFYAFTYEKAFIGVKSSSETVFDKIEINKDPQNKFVTLKNHFNNGDWIFLDIRNQFNNSLNFENNIAANIAVKLGDSASYVNNYSYPVWPLLKFQIGGLSNISIKIPKSDFTTARAYFRDNNKDAYTFKAINFDTSNYSTEFKLELPKSQSGITIGCYFYFMFLREIDDNLVPSEWVVKPGHFVDTMFDIEDLLYTDSLGNIKIKGIETFSKPTKWNIFEDNTFVFKNERSFMAKNAVAEDSENLYLFAFSNGESPQVSSFDLPIVAGESDKPKFLEDELLPKFNNSITFYSYELDHAEQAVYVLKDNINGAVAGNNVKLSPNKNNFVLIAIDKSENLVKLKNAYLEFANNLPKRLVLKDRHQITSTSGKKYWEATVVLAGYGNNTVTNSYEVKVVDTTIKLIYEKQDQCFLGTNTFNQNYVKDELDVNGLNFEGVIFKGFRANLRTSPFTSSSNNILGATGLDNYKFRVLGKCEGDSYLDSTRWYYIELLDDVTNSNRYLEPDNTDYQTQVGVIFSGIKCYLHSGFEPYIYAKYDQFINDFIELNASYDTEFVAQYDNLSMRITRLRLRSHNSDVWLFDVVTGGGWSDWNTVLNAVHLSDLTDIVGMTKIVDGVTINLNIQLLRDYSGIKFYNGEVADIQHMLVGLDTIDNKNNMQLLGYGNVINVNIALYAGDAGTVPAALLDMYDTYQNHNIDFEEFIAQHFNQLMIDSSFSLPFTLEEFYYQHLQNKSFPRWDMNGDFYCFGLNTIKNKMIYVVNGEEVDSNTISPSQRVVDVFDAFNEAIDIYEKESMSEFYGIMDLVPGHKIESVGVNAVVYNKMVADTIVFAHIWYNLKINSTSLIDILNSQDPKFQTLIKYAKLSINEYFDFIDKQPK